MQSLEQLQSNHESCNPRCITRRCRKGQCVFRLPPQGALGVDCDKCNSFPKNNPKPDFIVLYVSNEAPPSRWFIVEMKGTADHPRHIIDQIQAGAQVIQTDPRFQVPQSPTLLVPLVLYDGRIHTADIAVFRKNRITARHCGIALVDLV